MDLKNEFVLFDPQKMPDVALPDVAGISVKPVLIPFDYKGEKYGVVYVGKSSKSLRKRDLRQHFSGNAAISTFRKSIGCLLGFPLIMQDGSQGQNGKAKFCVKDEEAVTKWMKDNLLLFYNVNVACKEAEKELIRVYDPPLNIQGGGNGANQSFRTELSRLRASAASEGQKLNVDASGTVVEKSKTRCSNCGINLIVPDELLREKYIKCLECGHVFKNPCYNPLNDFAFVFYMVKSLGVKGIAVLGIWIYVLWAIFTYEEKYDYNDIKANAKLVVKDYLDDRDSYKAEKWGDLNYVRTEGSRKIYTLWHSYRFKNLFGGYVKNEQVFTIEYDTVNETIGVVIK